MTYTRVGAARGMRMAVTIYLRTFMYNINNLYLIIQIT